MNKRIICVLLSIILCISAVFCTVASYGIDLTDEDTYAYRPLKSQCMNSFGISSSRYDRLVEDIHRALLSHSPYCALSDYGIEASNENIQLVAKICKDYCDIFNISNRFSFSRSYGSSNLSKVNFNYVYSESETAQMQVEIDASVDKIISDLVDSSLTDVEKALIIHDRIITLCKYDSSAYSSVEALPDDDFTVYGVFVNHVAVCEGYTRAYSYALSKLGIQSYSTSSDNYTHMWNIVEIAGKTFHVDLTYDDPMMDMNGRVNHNYFMISTAKLQSLGRTVTDYDVSPTSTLYDNGYWNESHSKVCFVNGSAYYFNSSTNNIVRINADGTETVIFTVPASNWLKDSTHRWVGNYTRMDTYGENLFYTTSGGVYLLDLTTYTSELYYEPFVEGHGEYQIYGFVIDGDSLVIDMSNTPNFTVDPLNYTEIAYTIMHDHVWELISSVPATYTAEGEEEYVCTICNEHKTEVIPKLEGILGDINGDGKVNTADCNIIKQIIIGGYTGNIDMADMNGDNKVNAADAHMLKSLILGL